MYSHGETDHLLFPKRIAPTRPIRYKDANISGKITGFNTHLHVVPDLYPYDPSESDAPDCETSHSMGPTKQIRRRHESHNEKTVRHLAYRTTDGPRSQFAPQAESDAQHRPTGAGRIAIAICGAAGRRAIARSSPARSRAPTTE